MQAFVKLRITDVYTIEVCEIISLLSMSFHPQQPRPITTTLSDHSMFGDVASTCGPTTQ